MEKLSLKQVRKLRGLTQEEFGKPLGLTRIAIARRESGETKWTLEEVRNICEVFSIDPSILSLEP